MDDLVTWLRQQLDDDARAAAACLEPYEEKTWGGRPSPRIRTVPRDGHWAADREPFAGEDERWAFLDGLHWPLADGDSSYHSPLVEEAEHIARWDPARVLAEVEAKRARVDLLIDGYYRATSDRHGDEAADALRNLTEDLLQLEAQPLAGRPGFRDEWRPA